MPTRAMIRWLSLTAPFAILIVFLVLGGGGSTPDADDNDKSRPAISISAPPAPPPAVERDRPLLTVSISPESRVKASTGGAAPNLRQREWTEFAIEIENAALMTSPLLVESEQAMLSDDDDARDRWLKIDLQPPGQLTGALRELRTVRLWSRDQGKRAAVLKVNAGQGTQDLGFRSDVLITFDITPSEES